MLDIWNTKFWHQSENFFLNIKVVFFFQMKQTQRPHHSKSIQSQPSVFKTKTCLEKKQKQKKQVTFTATAGIRMWRWILCISNIFTNQKLKFPKRSAVERLGKIIWKSTIKVFQTVNKYISITDKQMFNNIHHFATITKGFHYLHKNNNE